MNIECLVEGKDICGESPLWHPEQECVYWTDINGFKINRYSPEKRELKSWRFDAPVSTLSLTTAGEWLLVAVGPRLILWSPAGDKRVPFAQPERDWPHNRLNDGATDPSGVFWVGSMRNNVGPDGSDLNVEGLTGSLYRANADGEVRVADSGFGITNTLVWSPDHSTFYCGCSIRNALYAYDYDATNSLVSNRRLFVENLAPGVPDGSAMDEEGCLWNCRYSGGCILRISPAGKVVRQIRMPVSNITNCGFGGDDLQTLYVTTSSLGAGVDERLAGSLFVVRTKVRGLGPARFRLSASTVALLAEI
jgi:sugar lactone lactonase YvrE